MRMVILFSFLMFGFGAAGTCLTEREGRVDKISLPNKIIYADFDRHLLNEHEQIFQAIDAGRDHVQDKLRQLFAQQKIHTKLAIQRSRRESLSGLLANKKIQWIGLEASQEEMKILRNRVADAKEMSGLLDMLNISGTLRDNVMDLMFDAHTLIELKNPELMKDVRVEPLEGPAKKLSMRATKAMSESMEMMKRIALQPSFSGDLEATLNVFDLGKKILGDFKAAGADEIARAVKSVKSPEMEPYVKAYLEAHNEVYRVALIRDVEMADRAVALEGNGYMAIGGKHGPGMKSRIGAACAQNSTGGAIR